MLLNLLNNAIKYTKKGKVTISVSIENDKYVLVSVKDEGIGISEEDQKKLF